MQILNITNQSDRLMVLIESSACLPPLQRNDPWMNQGQPVPKILAGPGSKRRPGLLQSGCHLCASSLLHWQRCWCPDRSSAIHLSSKISLLSKLYQGRNSLVGSPRWGMEESSTMRRGLWEPLWWHWNQGPTSLTELLMVYLLGGKWINSSLWAVLIFKV